MRLWRLPLTQFGAAASVVLSCLRHPSGFDGLQRSLKLDRPPLVRIASSRNLPGAIWVDLERCDREGRGLAGAVAKVEADALTCRCPLSEASSTPDGERGLPFDRGATPSNSGKVLSRAGDVDPHSGFENGQPMREGPLRTIATQRVLASAKVAPFRGTGVGPARASSHRFAYEK